jgi:hypothetical protein
VRLERFVLVTCNTIHYAMYVCMYWWTTQAHHNDKKVQVTGQRDVENDSDDLCPAYNNDHPRIGAALVSAHIPGSARILLLCSL